MSRPRPLNHRFLSHRTRERLAQFYADQALRHEMHVREVQFAYYDDQGWPMPRERALQELRMSKMACYAAKSPVSVRLLPAEGCGSSARFRAWEKRMIRQGYLTPHGTRYEWRLS